MRRGGALRRVTPLRPRSRKRTRREITYAQVRRDVEARAKGRCELRTPVCDLRGSECHHLLPRSAGGRDELANCAWTCSACHRFAHANPTMAYANGWLRRRTA